MKNIVLLITLFILTVGKYLQAKTISRLDSETAVHDTTSLALRPSLTFTEFNFQANRFLHIMQNNDKLTTINDYIILVRLFNTFCKEEDSRMFGEDIIRNFIVLFDHRYFNPSIYELNAQKNCESCDYFSIKYNVRIGISPKGHQFRKEDFYRIKEKQ